MPEMSHRQRVMATLRGEPVDRVPVGFWRHFFDKETTAEGLAEAMLSFQRRCDWDFMKVNPRASYHVEDWGYRVRYSGDPLKEPERVDYPIKSLADWAKLHPLQPTEGVLGEMLQALSLIRQGLKGEVPFIMTIFTPLSIAGRLAGSEENLIRQMRESPQVIQSALALITSTYAAFARECRRAGAEGIFLATTTWATYERLSDEDYATFGRPYDLEILDAVAEAPFNVLHVCRGQNMLLSLLDYPVAAFNWDATDLTNPSLEAGRARTSKTLIGGVDHREAVLNRERLVAQVRQARQHLGRVGWMLGPGCTISPRTPEENLQAAKEALSGLPSG